MAASIPNIPPLLLSVTRRRCLFNCTPRPSQRHPAVAFITSLASINTVQYIPNFSSTRVRASFSVAVILAVRLVHCSRANMHRFRTVDTAHTEPIIDTIPHHSPFSSIFVCPLLSTPGTPSCTPNTRRTKSSTYPFSSAATGRTRSRGCRSSGTPCRSAAT